MQAHAATWQVRGLLPSQQQGREMRTGCALDAEWARCRLAPWTAEHQMGCHVSCNPYGKAVISCGQQ